MALSKDNVLSIDECIHVFGKQMPSFAILAVAAKENQFDVIHSIKCLLVPLGIKHKNCNDTLIFINDADDTDNLPKIVKPNWNDFQSSNHPASYWFSNYHEKKDQLLPLTEQFETAHTAKYIPIPVFPVLLFLSEDSADSVLHMFQDLYDTFYEKSLTTMQTK